MKRKILIACVILLSIVLVCSFLFILKLEKTLPEPPETVPSGDTGHKETAGTVGETGSGETVETTGNTENSETTETTGNAETAAPTENTDPLPIMTNPADPVQTQPKETTPPATTKPVETTVPTETTKPKRDPDELPLVPNN